MKKILSRRRQIPGFSGFSKRCSQLSKIRQKESKIEEWITVSKNRMKKEKKKIWPKEFTLTFCYCFCCDAWRLIWHTWELEVSLLGTKMTDPSFFMILMPFLKSSLHFANCYFLCFKAWINFGLPKILGRKKLKHSRRKICTTNNKKENSSNHMHRLGPMNWHQWPLVFLNHFIMF